MSANLTSDIRPIPLAALQLSQTPAQKERRAHFDQAKLNELAESLKSVGLLQPIVVRPSPFREVDEESFEVVAGERRVQASKIAGLEEILASVRDLDDHQVAKIQLIENLQREDVHPLAEAEGYDELLKLHGYNTEQLAAEVGKSKAYVYARLKLLALDPASREAFYRGELNASTALLIARIPVASLQRKACIEITKPRYGDERMSYREALDHIQDTYMLRLEDAPFPTDRADLVRNVGACGACPKRAGNQPQLFEDVKGADVCTDPTCFKSKREAWGKEQLSQAKAKGQTVIAGASAKKVKPYDHSDTLQGGYVRLDEKCWDDPKKRTYRQLVAGTDVAVALLQVPKTGEVIQIVQEKTAMKVAGVKRPTETRSPSQTPAAKAENEKRARERDFRRSLLMALGAGAPKQLTREDLEGVACALFEYNCGDEGESFELLSLPKPPGTAFARFAKAFPDHVREASAPALNAMVLVLSLRGEMDGLGLSKPSKPLVDTAKRLKIDVEKIRKELAAAEKAKEPVPAKASKRKAGKKS